MMKKLWVELRAHSFQSPERLKQQQQLQPPTSASEGTPSPNTRRQQMTQDEKDKQDLLRNVLTAFANHNPTVGYCQGQDLLKKVLTAFADHNPTIGYCQCPALCD